MAQQRRKTRNSVQRHTTSRNKPFNIINKEKSHIRLPQPQRPTIDDHDAWRIYWQIQNQSWRTEPEISPERQAELEKRRALVPDFDKGIYPFKGMKLDRADVEWLLATHDGGPVKWNDEKVREREGLDVRGADLQQVDLHQLPLTRLCGGLTFDEWLKATEEQRNSAAVLMRGANLFGAQLKGANLSEAQLEGADLSEAQLKGANLSRAQLEGADLSGAQLEGAILVGAQLEGADLSGAQLEGVDLSGAQLEGVDLSEAQLEGASLFGAQLKGANLFGAQLKGASLVGTQLEGANLFGAQLEGANLSEVQLKGADLSRAQLEGANLSRAQLKGANLTDIKLGDKQRIGPRIADAQWNDINLAVVDWSQVTKFGDEWEAKQKQTLGGNKKEKDTRLNEYRAAVRASRQLAVALQSQGLNEEAARFAYRAQLLQRIVLRRQRKLVSYLFSGFLDLIAGYGYRPGRTVLWYLFVIVGFAVAYFAVGHLPPFPDAFVFSLMSFHGRGFFPSLSSETSLHNQVVEIASIEAVVGLLIEISFIATFTQRYFGK